MISFFNKHFSIPNKGEIQCTLDNDELIVNNKSGVAKESETKFTTRKNEDGSHSIHVYIEDPGQFHITDFELEIEFQNKCNVFIEKISTDEHIVTIDLYSPQTDVPPNFTIKYTYFNGSICKYSTGAFLVVSMMLWCIMVYLYTSFVEVLYLSHMNELGMYMFLAEVVVAIIICTIGFHLQNSVRSAFAKYHKEKYDL